MFCVVFSLQYNFLTNILLLWGFGSGKDVSTFALYLARFHLDCYKMFLFSFYTFQFFWQMASLSGVTFDNYIFERLNMILLLEIIPELPWRLGHTNSPFGIQENVTKRYCCVLAKPFSLQNIFIEKLSPVQHSCHVISTFQLNGQGLWE